MPEENHDIPIKQPESINSPEPINQPEPIDTSEGWTILTKFGGAAIAVCGGFVAFTTIVAPTRVMGATSSGKLKWQQANVQIQAAAPANPAGVTNDVSQSAPAPNNSSPLNDGQPPK
jgi:hypothetical protein